jgi:hypothetical protein
MGASSDIQSSMKLATVRSAVFQEFLARCADPGDPAMVAGAADVLSELPVTALKLSTATVVAIPAILRVQDSVA